MARIFGLDALGKTSLNIFSLANGISLILDVISFIFIHYTVVHNTVNFVLCLKVFWITTFGWSTTGMSDPTMNSFWQFIVAFLKWQSTLITAFKKERDNYTQLKKTNLSPSFPKQIFIYLLQVMTENINLLNWLLVTGVHLLSKKFSLSVRSHPNTGHKGVCELRRQRDAPLEAWWHWSLPVQRVWALQQD